MDPITIGIILLLIAGGAGAGAAVVKWEDILTYMKGKQIAVLGARQVGKTTLLTYIEKQVMITAYEATLVPREVGKKRLNISDLENEVDIRLKKTRDVAGSGKADAADIRVQWKKLCDDSDIILYIVRTDKLLHEDKKTGEIVMNDLQHIGKWIENKDKKNKNKQLVIVGNHWNTDPDYKDVLHDAKAGAYRDRFTDLPVVIQAAARAGGTGNVKFALGSLADKRTAQDLITSIFSQVVPK